MLLKQINLQNFRNISFAALPLCSNSQFFLGQNAQGKTNLIEAISLLTALRSFRTQDIRSLIQHCTPEAQVLYVVDHPKEGEIQLLLKLTPQKKELYFNNTKINRLSDFMGTIPTTVLSSEDIQFLRGTPSLRRRWVDLTLSAMHPQYFDDLRRYHHALLERNALLRQYPLSQKMLEAYNALLAPLVFRIYQKRAQELSLLHSFLTEAYQVMVKELELPELIYKPDCTPSSINDYLEILNQNFEKDHLFKSTQRGPHRDDLEFKVLSKPARQYASEGQQRGLVVALRLAQIQYFKHYSGLNPIILVDDVLAQLDPIRSKAFWTAIDPNTQVIATGTLPPSENSRRDWQIFNVSGGSFTSNSDRVGVGPGPFI